MTATHAVTPLIPVDLAENVEKSWREVYRLDRLVFNLISTPAGRLLPVLRIKRSANPGAAPDDDIWLACSGVDRLAGVRVVSRN
jgi:hypothetical protein